MYCQKIRMPAKYLLLGLLTPIFIWLTSTMAKAAETESLPINCATAEGDIRAMNSEIKHAQDQKLRNIAAVTPAGALLGIATGTEGERLQMLSGEYEKKLNARIAATKAECNL